MRVLEIIKTLEIGGAETLLVNRLAAIDHAAGRYEVAYVAAAHPAISARLEDLGIHVHKLSRSYRHPSWIWRLRKLMGSGEYDVLHVHSPLLAVVVRLLRLTGRHMPISVMTEHSVHYRAVVKWLNALTVRRDACLIAVSDAVAQGSVARRAVRAQVVRHGVPLVQTAGKCGGRGVETLGPESAGRTVVSIANYRPAKDLLTLLAAARIVHAQLEDVRFILIGEGECRPQLEHFVREHSMLSYVRLAGRVAHASEVLAAADVFALSSAWEGLPVAVMEALAAGVPVVSTNVGGLAELVKDGETGYLVPPGDPSALAESLCNLLRNPEHRERMAAAARESAAALDVRNSASTIDGILCEAVARHERR